MGILDDAIREHLDLKRKHGAREAELREIEDEAFGSIEQPDPFAAGGELFGDVSAESATESPAGRSAIDVAEPGAPDVGGEEPTRLVEPEALRPEPALPGEMSSVPPEPATPEPLAPAMPEPEAPEPMTPEPDRGSYDEPEPPESVAPIPGQAELPGQDEIPGQERLDEDESYRLPTEEEPAVEPPSPSESLEDLISEEEPFPEDSAAPPPAASVPPPAAAEPAEGPAPGSQEIEPPAEAESSVPDPPPPPPATGPEPPGRARGRVDVPTQEHPTPGQTGGVPVVPPAEPEPEIGDELEPEPEPPEPGGPQLYDFESDEEQLAAGPADEPADEFEALGPAEDEEAPYLEEEEAFAEEPVTGTEAPLDEPGTEVRPALEDEEAYEGGGLDPEEGYEEDEGEEGLWFEKGPPKDFDFD
jgi:hypothetical protein